MAARGRSLGHARLRVGFCLSANSRIHTRLGRFLGLFCPRPSQKQSAGPRRRRRSGSDAAGVLSHLLPLPSAGSWRSVPQWSSASRGPKEWSWGRSGRLVVPLALARRSPSTLSLLASFTRPQLGRDDPLNLSILLRGGKENNDDSLSKGD